MTARVTFYFDVGSGPSYLAHLRLPPIVARAGAELVYRPILAGGLFKATGNAPPLEVDPKRAYIMDIDLPRLGRHYGVPMNYHPDAPPRTLSLMRGAIVADRLGRLEDYADTVLRAIWADAKNMSDPAVVREVLTAAGFDTDDLLTRIGEQNIKDELIANTEEAVARGCFGVPTIFVNDEIFFGQDRMDLIEKALA
jgi:2-hydroxychromene-2-carboxylate isomerase